MCKKCYRKKGRRTNSKKSTTVGGDINNTASGKCATISGGCNNIASGIGSTVSGGLNNKATGIGSTVSGGLNNKATGNHSWVGGQCAHTNKDNTFIWSDGYKLNGNEFIPSQSNSFNIVSENGIEMSVNNKLVTGNINKKLQIKINGINYYIKLDPVQVGDSCLAMISPLGDITMHTDDTLQFNAVIDGFIVPSSSTSWASADPSIAIVNANNEQGLVRAVKIGMTQITVSFFNGYDCAPATTNIKVIQ